MGIETGLLLAIIGAGAIGGAALSSASRRGTPGTDRSRAATPSARTQLTTSPVKTGAAQEARAPGRGARLSLISTGPQGVFGNAPVGRRKLLAN